MKVKQRSLSGWQLPLVALPLLMVVFGVILARTAAPANAATIYNMKVPLSNTGPNPCNNEVVTFSGDELETLSVTLDGSGGGHLDMHTNFQDVTGIGSFGNKYQIPLTDNFESNVRVGLEVTFTESELIVSQGSAPNFVVIFDSHITVNPDLTVTSSHDNFRTECRG